jgi:hypothetical protein
MTASCIFCCISIILLTINTSLVLLLALLAFVACCLLPMLLLLLLAPLPPLPLLLGALLMVKNLPICCCIEGLRGATPNVPCTHPLPTRDRTTPTVLHQVQLWLWLLLFLLVQFLQVVLIRLSLLPGFLLLSRLLSGLLLVLLLL